MKLDQLGAQVAGALDRGAAPEADLAAARRGFLASVGRPSRALPRRARWVVLAAALLASVALAVVVARRPGPLTFAVVSGASAAAEVGAWLAAPTSDELALRFSEGSTLLLEPRGRLRVEGLRPEGATLRLEEGRVAVSVAPRAGNDWRVWAGPFEVRVTGTRFDVSWEPRTQRFSVTLHDGSVVVFGPTLGAGATVVAGQTLRVELGGAAGGAASAASATPPPALGGAAIGAASGNDGAGAAGTGARVDGAGAPSAARAQPGDAAPGSAPTSGAGSAAAVGSLPRGWRQLAVEGEYRPALAAAEAQGIEALLTTAPAADLVLLGDTARFAGNAATARRAYLAVRERFAGSPSAAHAAFALGRMGGAGALGWFERYLGEAPAGPFAREAMGRVLELQHAGGQADAARATARRYLDAWGGGPHAELARAILGVAAGSPGAPPASSAAPGTPSP